MKKITKVLQKFSVSTIAVALAIIGILSFGTVALATTSNNISTHDATSITTNDAVLNGTNEDNDAIGHSFWASLSTFETTSPTLPIGVYSTSDLGAISLNTPFSANLSSISGLNPITPNTTYYFSAWSNVEGTWYPGEVKSFTTESVDLPGTGTEGTIGGTVTGGAGTGTLAVTSVTTVNGTATADGTFENGWKYLFNITVPTNESNLAMKFANWVIDGGGSTILVANNMRISSSQADNSNATVLLTAENTYSTPTLHMTGDMNPSMNGMQVQVLVETAVPQNSVNGAYTTSYGVETN